MKKKVFFIAILVTILIIGGYYFRYRRVVRINNKIPTIADQVILVDLRKMEQYIVNDVIQHPLTYFSEKEDRREGLLSQLDLSRNTLFYTLKEIDQLWFSSLLKLKPNHTLASYFTENEFLRQEGNEFSYFTKGNLVIAIQGNQLLIAYIEQGTVENLSEVLRNRFTEHLFLTEDDELLKPLITLKGALVYSSLTNGTATVIFENDGIVINGNSKNNVFKVIEGRSLKNDKLASIVTQLNLELPLVQKWIKQLDFSKFESFTHLDTDSLLMRWDGSIDFSWNSIKYQNDTSITYEYDDNFNKQEIVTVSEKLTPVIECSLSSPNQLTLWDYLTVKKAIDYVGKDTLLVAMPFAKLYAKPLTNKLIVSSSKEIEQIEEKDTFCLSAYIDIENSLKYEPEFYRLPTENKQLQLLKSLDLIYDKQNKWSSTLQFKNNERNALVQLLRTM